MRRTTKQKVMMEKAISGFETFFTAEELFSSMNEEIGIATIYRFLNDEKKNGNLHSYLCERKTLYSKNKTNHCHFICSECNRITHIDIEKIDFLKKDIPGKMCHFQIDVYGVCNDCQKRIKR